MRSFPEKISVMTLGGLCRNPKGGELMTEAQESLSQSYPSGRRRQQAASLRPRHLAARGSHPRGMRGMAPQ